MQPRRVYAKQHLHADELPFFVPGDAPFILEAGRHRLAPAICYESLLPEHAAAAAGQGADLYLASVAKPAGGMARAVVHYPAVARAHGMFVLMVNSIGPSDTFVSVGQSAVWDDRGELLGKGKGVREKGSGNEFLS